MFVPLLIIEFGMNKLDLIHLHDLNINNEKCKDVNVSELYLIPYSRHMPLLFSRHGAENTCICNYPWPKDEHKWCTQIFYNM